MAFRDRRNLRRTNALRALAPVAFAWGCADVGEAPPGRAVAELISEQDDRNEPYAEPFSWMRSYAENGTVALVDVSRVTPDPYGGEALVEGPTTLGQGLNLCAGERFAEQRMTAFCSGTLIDDDLVLTSASCMSREDACARTRFVLGHNNSAPGSYAFAPGVYACESVVVRQDGSPALGEPNFAVVRLTRPVWGNHLPVPLRAERDPLDPGQHVKLVGFPYGIPAKIDAQGTVTNNAWRANYFSASLDVFPGEEGAGVYEGDGYTLAGIHVTALPDGVDPLFPHYRPVALPDGGTCNTATRCTGSRCTTSAVLSVGPVLDALCADPSRSERLCSAAAPANDRPDRPARLPLLREATIYGSTQYASHSVTPTCGRGTAASPDVFYSMHIDTPLIFYVDAFTSEFPVVLSLMRDSPTAANTLACNAGACNTGQGQLAAALRPGTYYLGVTGAGGTRGRFTLHLQAVTGTANAIRVSRGSGTLTGASAVTPGDGFPFNTCGGAHVGSTAYYYVTCPDYRGGELRASTCSATSNQWDTVLTLEQGNTRQTFCADDSCGPQSTLRATVMPGSGVRALYLYAKGASGPYAIAYRIP